MEWNRKEMNEIIKETWNYHISSKKSAAKIWEIADTIYAPTVEETIQNINNVSLLKCIYVSIKDFVNIDFSLFDGIYFAQIHLTVELILKPTNDISDRQKDETVKAIVKLLEERREKQWN